MLENLEVDLTLRCNQKCINCSRYCNTPQSGLRYGSETDLTMNQIEKFCDQVIQRSKQETTVINQLTLLGGEPLLHPQVVLIVNTIHKYLLVPKLVKHLRIITNNSIPIPRQLLSLANIQTMMPLEKKSMHHSCFFTTCYDLGYNGPAMVCKDLVNCGPHLSYTGYSPCPSATTIIRFFQIQNGFVFDLPKNNYDFPYHPSMVCAKCPMMAQIPSINMLSKIQGKHFISHTYNKQMQYNLIHPPKFRIF